MAFWSRKKAKAGSVQDALKLLEEGWYNERGLRKMGFILMEKIGCHEY
jgi:hypothetical protein